MRALYVAVLCCVLVQADAFAKTNPDFEHLLSQGRLEYLSAHFSDAEKSFLAALKTLQRDDEEERAAALSELGDVYLNKDDPSRAESVYSEALTIFKRRGDNTKMIAALRNLGAIYSLRRRDDEAVKVLQQGLRLAKASSEKNPALTAQMLNSLGIAYYRQGRMGKAKNSFDQALQLVSTANKPFDFGELMINLGMVYYVKHDFAKAEGLFQRGLKAAETGVGPTHPDVTFALSALAMLYTNAGRYDEAEACFFRTLSVLRQNEKDFDTRIARVLHAMSLMYTKAGRSAEAATFLASAAVIAHRNVEAHLDMATILEDYAAALRQQGNTTEAEEFRSVANRARVAASLVVHARNRYE